MHLRSRSLNSSCLSAPGTSGGGCLSSEISSSASFSSSRVEFSCFTGGGEGGEEGRREGEREGGREGGGRGRELGRE